MSLLGQTLVLYLVVGVGVAAAVYLSAGRGGSSRWFPVVTAVAFWPLYLPILLTRRGQDTEFADPRPSSSPDVLGAAIRQVNAELEAALASLDGWAEGVLAREKGRLDELRSAWTAQAARIREMDRLLARPEYAEPEVGAIGADGGRFRSSQEARRQNVERLRRVRRRTYEDLMGTLAWVRELVSMIHLAKFTGAPASRAEELVAQVAAAVEGLSALTWQDEPLAPAAGNT
jgi:hypothetical protein